MKSRFIFLFIFSFFILIKITNAQQMHGATGGDLQSSAGKVAFSIGHPIYTYINGPGGSATHGVHHHNVSTNVALTKILKLKVYPNPSTDFLNLTYTDVLKNLSFKIYDSKAMLCMDGPLNKEKSQFDIRTLKPGAYVLEISSNNKVVCISKFIKN